MFARLTTTKKTAKMTTFISTHYYQYNKWDITVNGIHFKGLTAEEWDFFYFNF